MSEEKKLVKTLNTGNLELINEFFEELYNKYKGLVCYIVSKYISSREDVFDIAQDVFLDFFNNANNVNTSIKFYLTSSAKNKALNYLKKYNRITFVELTDLDLLESKSDFDGFVFIDTVNILKDNLTDIEFNILSLHLLENITFKNIALKLNMKLSTVKTLYFRALKKSRSKLERSKPYE